MRLVIDASVVVGICYTGGELGGLRGHELHAPALLPAEVTSSIHEAAYRGEVPATNAAAALEHLDGIPVTFEAPGARARAAFQLADQLGWAKTYDAEYVALARAMDAPLVTLDGRLQRGAAGVAQVIGPDDVEAAGHDPEEPDLPSFSSGLDDLGSRTDELLEGFGER